MVAKEERDVRPHDPELRAHFIRNKIRTTKYTWYNIVPKNLFEQFHRFANVYFLFIVILNWIPQINAFGKEIAMLPLLFVLAVTFVKDLFEDRRRGQSDVEINNKESHVFRNGKYMKIKWKNICVGDIVKLEADEIIPADLVLLHVHSDEGLCFVETANLDGETNLKQRRSYIEHENDFNVAEFRDTIRCEAPNNKIYEFNGKTTRGGSNAPIPVDSDHMLLRGCIVRNTEFVIGMVVYAGHETKAMLNNTGPRAKRSKLERNMNREVIFCLIILLVMCVAGGIGSAIWTSRRDWKDTLYLVYESGDPEPPLEGFIRFWTFFIVLQAVVPISLYVSIELVKLMQVYFLIEDKELYHEESNKKMNVRALNITEDLGQIEYVFSDKTGTLTQNKMVFHTCSIGGKNYPHADKEPGKDCQDQFSFPRDANLMKDVDIEDPEGQGILHEFLLCMAVCNTVVPAMKEASDSYGTFQGKQGVPVPEIKYEAESPDEAALVAAAKVYGYTLKDRNSKRCVVSVKGNDYEYKVLDILPFDSRRKRMSVVVELPSGQKRMYCKGADSAILAAISEDSNKELVKNTRQHIDEYARAGLRTLCFSYRDLSEDEYVGFHSGLEHAYQSFENRKDLIQDCASSMENDLVLLGASGVEDKLQDGVPETIASLREAGLNVWVLTGDKQETAIEIAFTCRLLTREMQQVKLNSIVAQEGGMPDDHILEEVAKVARRCVSEAKEARESGKEVGMIVDGATLAYVLRHRQTSDIAMELQDLFLKLTSYSKVVVCCRMAPLQKAQVVKLVKDHQKVMTLSIGDGANDVSMIQMADVGVGISGQEGMQAVMASDFAIAQFRFLKRLLLVHGHWSYVRLSDMILYFFYKNCMYAFLIYWFMFFCGFSGQNAIEQMYLFTYNLAWTALPPIITAVFDQNVSDKMLLLNPWLYENGRLDKTYKGKFWPNIYDALWASLALFFVPYFAYLMGLDNNGIVYFGTIMNTGAVFVANIVIALITRHWTIINFVVVSLSCILYFAFALVYNGSCCFGLVPDPFWVMQTAMQAGPFYLTLLLATFVAVLPRWVVYLYSSWFYPTAACYVREMEVINHRAKDPSTCFKLSSILFPVRTTPTSRASTAPVGFHTASNSVILNSEPGTDDA